MSGITQRLPSLPYAQEQHPKHSLECNLRIALKLLTELFYLLSHRNHGNHRNLVRYAIYGHQDVVCVEVDKKAYLLIHQSEVSKKLFRKHLLHFLD